MTVRYYPAIIERGTSGYGVFFPDLPGCVSAGDTAQEAAVNAEEALQAHLELTVESGFPFAPPSELDAVRMDADIDEVARILVRAEVPGRAVRVNVTLPADLLAAVDRHAKAHGVLLNHRGGRLRASPHAYNTEAEVDHLVEVVCQ